jgi:hypothetical protein
MIDNEIREACDARSVVYSTWIDDLAFSGSAARELIPISAKVLQRNGLKISRYKVRIMGPREIKILTGARLGCDRVRAPREKLSRVRSGIHKLRSGLVSAEAQERFIEGIVGQIEYIERLTDGDGRYLITQLHAVVDSEITSARAGKFLRKNF